MNWSRHVALLTVSVALLVVVAGAGAWAVESGFGARADAGGLPLVALGKATTATAPGSSSAPNMAGAAGARLVVEQSLRMSPDPVKSGVSGAGSGMMGTAPISTGATAPPVTPTTTHMGGGMGSTTGTAGMGGMSTGTTMGPQSTTGTTAQTESGGMMGTALTTAPPTLPSVTPTSTYMGGGMGSTTGTTGGSGMGGMTAP